MSYSIEVLSVGGDYNDRIEVVAEILNLAQSEFEFVLPPLRLRDYGERFVEEEYNSVKVWEFLRNYRAEARGYRPFLIAIVDRKLNSEKWQNLFGSHRACDGMAVITLHDHERFAESYRPFLCYYFIRYALSFACPSLKSHREKRESACFFDFKENKADLRESLDCGNFCDECRRTLWKEFNPEIKTAIEKMVAEMKLLRADSQEALKAQLLKGKTDFGIITIRGDEFEAMLNRFASRRLAEADSRSYAYSWVRAGQKEEFGVALRRCPDQGQGSAQAVASNMIDDLSPRWILLVGIAGGFPDYEYTLGDVLLSKRVHDFAVSAALEGRASEFQDQGGPMHPEVEDLITTKLPAQEKRLGEWNTPQSLGLEKPGEKVPGSPRDKRFYGGKEWREKAYKSLQRHFPQDRPPQNPRYWDAPMIDGNTLVKNTGLATKWRQTARHAAGVEMELGGVYRAARYSPGGKTHVLAIRGISDIVGYERRPEWTEFACRSASAFAYALIVSGIIRKDTVL